jgi:hypothetical protein
MEIITQAHPIFVDHIREISHAYTMCYIVLKDVKLEHTNHVLILENENKNEIGKIYAYDVVFDFLKHVPITNVSIL